MGNRAIWVAAGVAVALHGLLAWLWPEPEPPVRKRFDVTLETKPESVSVTSSATQSPPPQTSASKQLAPAVDKPREPVTPEPDIAESPRQQIAETHAQGLPSPEAPQSTLDLSYPADWPQVEELDDVDAHVSAFRPDFFQGLEARRKQQTRTRLSRERRIATRGRTPDEYNALTSDRFHIKTEQGCFDQRMEMNGRVIGERRWWRTGCKELLDNPLNLPSLEYDALGRAVGVRP